MRDVVLLSLSDRAGDAGAGSDTCTNSDTCTKGGTGANGGTGASSDTCGSAGAAGCGGGCADDAPRVPVLRCVDALSTADTRVNIITANSDAQIDAAIKPVAAGEAGLIVAATADGQVRAVLRRLVRHYAPAPSKRPDHLPADRTVPDLPAVGILPLLPAVPELVTRLGLPREPADVAAALRGARERRLDLLRNDGGSITMRAALLGGSLGAAPAAWYGRVEVDDAVLSDGTEPVLACAITNVGAAEVDGLPLIEGAVADDGMLDVAVAVPTLHRRPLRRAGLRFEVRRTRGRAVSISPRQDELPIVDDGVTGALTRKRSWWIERGVWAAYVL